MIRFKNLIIIILTQYFVRFFLIKPILNLNGGELAMPEDSFALLVLATLLITAAGYIVNDYFDIEIDKINKPGKNIIGEKISVFHARILYFGINVLATGIGFWLAYEVDMLHLGFGVLLVIIMLWYYSIKYKRQLLSGNFVVAVMSAFAIYIVWMFEFFWLRENPALFADMITEISTASQFVLGLTFFAFIVSLIREIAKDMEDIDGDKSVDCRTLPIVVGMKYSKYITVGIIIIAIIAMGYGQLYLWQNNFDYIFWYFMMIVQPLFVYTIFKVIKAEKKEDFYVISNTLKIIMLAGILSVQLIQLSY